MIAEQPQSLDALFGACEALHPELTNYLQDDPYPMLRHPLVYSIPHSENLNAYANHLLADKKRRLQAAIDQQNWLQCLLLHESPYRLQAFTQLSRLMTDPEYWQHAGWVWCDSENAHEQRARWVSVFCQSRTNQQCLMTPDEQLVFQELPQQITLYRGCHQYDHEGLSWSMDKSQAQWFADRFAHKHDCQTHVLCQTFDKSQLLAFFNRRNETEILVHPTSVMDIPYE